MNKKILTKIILGILILIIGIVVGAKISHDRIVNNIKVVDFLDDDKIILQIDNDIRIYNMYEEWLNNGYKIFKL